MLIYRLGSLGDTLVALPAFRLVRDAYLDAEIVVLTNPPTYHAKAVALQEVLQGTGLVDDILYFPHHARNPLLYLRLLAVLARKRFHCLVYMSQPHGTMRKIFRHSLFFRLAGIRRQIGFPKAPEDLEFRPLSEGGLYESETARQVRNLSELGTPDLEDDRWWDLRLSDDEHAEAGGLLAETIGSGPFFAFSVGTKFVIKDWTEPNWADLVARLKSRCPGVGLVAIGDAQEAEVSDRLLQHWDGPTLNLCGRTRPRASAAVLARASLYVGHDSGPMHLAANVGTPCVAIFAAREPPGAWFPRGRHNRPLYHKTECFGCSLLVCTQYQNLCILSITVDEVLAAIDALIAIDPVGGTITRRPPPLAVWP